MMNCFHDSHDLQYRYPFGAVAAGTAVKLSLRVSEPSPSLSCTLHLWRNQAGGIELPMERAETEDGAYLFTLSPVISEMPDLCWYYFILEDGGNRGYYGNNQQKLGGVGQLYYQEPPGFQITVHKEAAVPSWYKNAIVYQIFPDRFARDENWLSRQMAADHGPAWKGPRRIIQQDWNDAPYYTRNEKGEITRWPFFGGSLQGIRDKLFYLKSLGIGAIYLNPIFLASSNHKYDTADYMRIDPAFGTEEDFHLLCRDAKKLGIRLILDGVFNHTGADSIYFNKLGNFEKAGACQGPESPYYNWYHFNDFPDDYESWWGVKDLPAVEEKEPSYQEFIYGGENSVIRKWLKEGASGWRLDVADELPDDFIAGIRSAVKETDPDGLLLGEVWEDASNKVSYGVQRRYFLGDELDATMNYPVREMLTDYMLGRTTAEDAVRKLNSLAENYPAENFYGALNLIGSHDRMRILTMLGDPPSDLSELQKELYRLPEEKLVLARNRLKALSLIQYILPGAPCLYYGDEAGAQGFEDPYNRGTYPWGAEDPELLEHYRILANLRKQYPVLTTGGFSFSWKGEHLLICERFDAEKGERIIAAINRNIFDDADITLELPTDTQYVLELLGSEEMDVVDSAVSIHLPAVSAKLLYCSNSAPQKLKLPRCAGILCHVSSLPTGKLNRHAEDFIDYLEAAGQKLWQVLPLNPPEGLSGSPYSSPGVFAGNGAFVDMSYNLKSSTANLYNDDAYDAFCREEAYWLEDYALYTIIKEHYNGAPWQQWPEAERTRQNLDMWRQKRHNALEIIKKEQFHFHVRWQQVKAYANEKGISIIGDIPIYVGVDSADTWAHRDAFLLGEDGYPLVGAGVPPDYFSETGQNWGNPLYNWDYMKETGYDWWLRRTAKAMKQYDYIRLDHFRSFAAYFAIPAGKMPKDGWWLPGIGKKFFDFLNEKLGPVPFLAEDLGLLDASVYNLLKLTGYPGMDIYQFCADEMAAMTDKEAASRVFYSGTHDNQTLAGWCQDQVAKAAAEAASPENTDISEAVETLASENAESSEDTSREGQKQKTPEQILDTLYESNAPWVIIPLQDLLGLDDAARMNVPGQTEGNWTWRTQSDQLTKELAARLKKTMIKTER